MKTIIAGSRDITDMTLVYDAVDESGFDISEVVCGKAPGVDTLGESYAVGFGIPVKSFPAKWKDITVPGAVIRRGKYGLYNAIAGHTRNQQMAEYADALIAVWDGQSTGTADMISRAKKLGLKVYIKYV